MNVICVDDHSVMLEGLVASVKNALPSACVHGFNNSNSALEFITENGCDILIGELELYCANGSLLAEEVKKLYPSVNIIFVTVCDEKEHAREVLSLKPSGYLTKPATRKQIFDELGQLRYPILAKGGAV